MLASKAGVDPEKLIEVLSGGLAGNKVMEVRRRNFLEHDFTPGFKLALHHKDLGIALRTARELDVFVPTTALVDQMLAGARGSRRRRARPFGAADRDRAAVVTPDLTGGPSLRIEAACRQPAGERSAQVRDHHLARPVEPELGVRRDVAAQDRVRRRQDRVVGRGGLAFEHVEAGRGDLTAMQCRDKRGLVDQVAARRVDEHRVGREQRELARADQSPGRLP